MLKHLQIRQFAIIDDLSVELESGMTVLSGETGAGKSILLDALELLLGGRADVSMIGSDAGRAEVDAEFVLGAQSEARRWLESRELQDPDEPQTCTIRRLVNRDGRTRCHINGRPVAARDLRALGQCLVDIHGQHAHQQLFRRQVQQRMLDEFGVPGELREQVAGLARRCNELQQTLNNLGDDDLTSQRRTLLAFQIDELDALQLADGELQELDGEQRRLANAERLLQEGGQALSLLYEGEEMSGSSLLGRAQVLLQGLAQWDDGFTEAAELSDSAAIQAREAADSLRRHLHDMTPDPERLQEVERRLSTIHDLARKHRLAPDELNRHCDTLASNLAALDDAAGEHERASNELSAALEHYRAAAAELSDHRHSAAAQMAQHITDSLRELGMPEAEFGIRVEPRQDDAPRSEGADKVEFDIQANAGQEARPVSRVASGGELSRISLAIQVNAIAQSPIPTMVFDEVDVGIGGAVAEIVGRLLRTLGAGAQVLCVTHLPQVAAQAQHHLFVSKQTSAQRTRTAVEHLEDTARVEELARMLGGVNITRRTREHAREMIQAARE